MSSCLKTAEAIIFQILVNKGLQNMIFTTNSPEETEKIGKLLAEKLDTAGHSSAFIALRGEMGVGKTAFASFISVSFTLSRSSATI